MKFKTLQSALLLPILLIQFLFIPQVSAQEFILPSDVEGLTTTPGDGTVLLKWDKSTDDDGAIWEYKIYYGASPVKTSEDNYDNEVLTGSDEASYLVKGLTNGTPYYFAITAIDDEDNESDGYSESVTTTPKSKKVENPAVVSAVHTAENTITVKLSKPVIVKSSTKSFFLEEKKSGNPIKITNTKVSGANVDLTFIGKLKKDTQYIVTASSLVEDLNGTPISSGLTDSTEFSGKVFKAPAPAPIKPPVAPIKATEPAKAELPKEVKKETPKEETKEPVKNAAPKDTVAPLDATSLLVDTSGAQKDGVVIFSWKPAIDSANDIADQIITVRVGTGEWQERYSVGKTATEVELDIEQNKNYEIKVITIDKTENESVGAIVKFSTHLNQSGPEIFLGAIIALVLGTMLFANRRRIA